MCEHLLICVIDSGSFFLFSKKQVEVTSQEVVELEARHDDAQGEVRKIKDQREKILQEALAKRRELKELNVSVLSVRQE